MAILDSGLSFAWYAPTHGDSTIIGGRDRDRGWSPSYIDEVAREAEAAGFESILIPTGPTCADPFLTAGHIVAATTDLVTLIAVRTGSWLPTVAAKAAMTVDQISGGRVSLNIVSGGSPMELAMDGDYSQHEVRYRRTGEYLEVLRYLWRGEPTTYKGEFFDITGAVFRPPIARKEGIPLYLGGASADAIRIAASFADVYLMWGEPAEAVSLQLDKARHFASEAGREIRYGMRINLIVEETTEAAWSKARQMVASVDPEMRERARAYLANSDSEGVARLQRVAGDDAQDPAYWTGMVPFRSGNSSALVGSPQEVAAALYRYVEAGISEFIFSAYPHLGTARLIGESVIPSLRRMVEEKSSKINGGLK